jgi:hypothetical protein
VRTVFASGRQLTVRTRNYSAIRPSVKAAAAGSGAGKPPERRGERSTHPNAGETPFPGSQDAPVEGRRIDVEVP